MSRAQLLVLAKQPVAGQVKTRLCPPLTPDQAAAVAEAALRDTLDAVERTAVDRRVLVLAGDFTAPGFVVQPQALGGLDRRIAEAFDTAWDACALPMLLIGMDTPQLDEVLLEKALSTLLSPGVDAVLGLAEDGGWWGLGLMVPAGELIIGVETSQSDTGARQLHRLREAGLAVSELPTLRDVDTVQDLQPVAALAPQGRFARAVAGSLA